MNFNVISGTWELANGNSIVIAKKIFTKTSNPKHTKNEQCIRQSTKDGKKQPADNSRAENLEQQLTAGGEKSCSLEHEKTINQDQEKVS